MQAITKSILVVAVLGIGIGAAIVYRKPSVYHPPSANASVHETSRSPSNGQLVLRYHADSPTEPRPPGVEPFSKPLPPVGQIPGPRLVKPVEAALVEIEAQAPKPSSQIASSFEEAALPPLPNLSPSLFSDPAPAVNLRVANLVPVHSQPRRISRHEPTPLSEESDEQKTHTIRDGDTLTTLAERYLGDASRSLEIYEANRDVLSDPNLLILGTTVKIPNRLRLPASTGTSETTFSPNSRERPKSQWVPIR